MVWRLQEQAVLAPARSALPCRGIWDGLAFAGASCSSTSEVSVTL